VLLSTSQQQQSAFSTKFSPLAPIKLESYELLDRSQVSFSCFKFSSPWMFHLNVLRKLIPSSDDESWKTDVWGTLE
jgi:hypothetical protein